MLVIIIFFTCYKSEFIRNFIEVFVNNPILICTLMFHIIHIYLIYYDITLYLINFFPIIKHISDIINNVSNISSLS